MDEGMQPAGNDMPPQDNLAEEGAEGNTLTFNVSDYPQLDGVKPGSQVSVKCTGTVGQSEGGQVSISIEGQCEIETESPATREYNQMRGANSYGKGNDDGAAGGADDEF